MNIYVGNLAREVTESDIRQAFEAFGEVVTINIIKDKYSGEPRGFGFVEMPKGNEAQEAIKNLDGKDLQGRTMKVNEAHPRPAGRRDSGPRGSKGRGFGRGGSREGNRGGGGDSW